MKGYAIITMAGFGNRFLKAGYTIPKYRIEAHGRSLFSWSMLSLKQFSDAGWEFRFIVRKADNAEDFITSECAALNIAKPRILGLDEPTDGQATTALLAGSVLDDKSAPIAIYNIDTFVEPQALSPNQIRGDGWVPCASLPGDAWSFARADENGLVSEMREKTRISDHCTIGLYYFSSFDLYEACYNEFYADEGNVEAGERYIAPMYNHLIKSGREVYISTVPKQAFYALGTPDDVSRFRDSEGPKLS